MTVIWIDERLDGYAQHVLPLLDGYLQDWRGCGWKLFLDIIGTEKFRHGVLPPFRSFTITCPECHKANTDTPSDVQEASLENPPSDYRCREFLEALQNE